MNFKSTINLLQKPKDIAQPQSPFERKFQNISSVISISIIILALLSGAAYMALRFEEQSLTNTKEKLITALAAQRDKEILYSALRERIGIIQSITADQKQWDKRFDLVNELGSPPLLMRFTGESTTELQVSFHVDSFDDVRTLASTLFTIFTRKDIENPRIVSYVFTEGDGISLTLGIEPTF